MRTIDKIYVAVAAMAIVVTMGLIMNYAFHCGIERGEYSGYVEGYDKGYEAGYDDGEWDGEMKGIRSHRESSNYLLKWCGETGHWFTKEIDGVTYKVRVEEQ